MLNQLFRCFGLVLLVSLLAACQGVEETPIEPTRPVSTATPTPNLTATFTPSPTATTSPSPTAEPTETLAPTPLPTSEQLAETYAAILERLLNPCYFKLHPLDDLYPNPQENLDPQSGTTWMAITVAQGVLQEGDVFHYWWDTRAFRGDLSFNKSDGLCEVLVATGQAKCEGIALRGTDNLPTGGYEYDFKLSFQKEGCVAASSYQQRGLIYMDTLQHDVFSVNGEDVP